MAVLSSLPWTSTILASGPALAPAPLKPEAMRFDRAWRARWIAPPAVSLADYGVYLFRREFDLATAPARFVVSVSADNRYRLFVNGTSVCFGPQAGEPLSWRFETVDLAPWLRVGKNVLAIQVWNFGEHRPYAQMSVSTGLIVQGDGDLAQVVDTGADGWRVHHDRAWSPLPADRAALQTFIVVSPGDEVDGAKHPWGWRDVGFDDRGWAAPRVLDNGTPAGVGTDIERWLWPREIPLMEETPQRLGRVRRAAGSTPPEGFSEGKAAWTIPPRTTAAVLLDQGFETNAFPRLTVSGGQGAAITLAYAEALVDAQRRKGPRDEIEGRTLIGVEDRFRPDGGARRVFTTLDYRTWRYFELHVQTGDEPLTIDDLTADATGYPLALNARFSSDDPALARIWEVGWRTARLCAADTYMDCPYYERLQYVGDTRIQALISLYLSGDDRLMRNAIALYDRSRLPDGLTQSRYPSRSPQVISPFSLFWIGMVHDYWMHRDDRTFVAAQQRGVDAVLSWFAEHVDARTGLLGPLPYWSFVDWPDAWPWNNEARIGGEPPGARTGGSSILTLQYAIALDRAADLARAFGRGTEAAAWAKAAADLRAAVMAQCWDAQRRLIADTPEKSSFSQHAQAVGVLSGAIEGAAARELVERTLADSTLIPCTVYFRFYLLRAMKQVGLGDRYLDQLVPWHDMLALGLSTFAERPEPTRSDCHAWSASPIYEFLATVCGVEPGSPGFKTVRVEPHLGRLQQVEGLVPHPRGFVRVGIVRRGARGLQGYVDLPSDTPGVLVWQGFEIPLEPGRNRIDL
ncbi:MAG: alpha-L-rhamnosidase [Opitutaceae bacterium]|nr:alpha-L-rhamnosidase [Opitutaceae bacterium]